MNTTIPIFLGVKDRRLAVIYLRLQEMPAFLGALKMTDIQGDLQDNGTFEALHEYLQLPESYTIHAVYLAASRLVWVLIVESDELPIYKDTEVIPEVVLKYQQHPDGTTRLLKIDVQENCYTVKKALRNK